MKENLERGMLFEMGELVQIQQGAVVSRTIIEKKTGTVTVFAFDVGQSLSEHTAPYDALVTILEGTADIGVGGASHHLAVGCSIIMPAGLPHSVSASEPMKMCLVMIRS